MKAIIVVVLVITMNNERGPGTGSYERRVPMGSIGECLYEASKVMQLAVKDHGDLNSTEYLPGPEVGAGCVLSVNPGKPL